MQLAASAEGKESGYTENGEGHERPATHRVDVEMAFVAAIRPKSVGSSTIGMKKSVVAMMQVSPSSCHTAASRAVLPRDDVRTADHVALLRLAEMVPTSAKVLELMRYEAENVVIAQSNLVAGIQPIATAMRRILRRWARAATVKIR